MDIHKPKPIHGVREVLKEYGIIVLGVLTALALEQAVEAFHRAHEVEIAQQSLDAELTIDAEYAYRLRATKACADKTMGLMQQALVSGRPELLNAIYTQDTEGNPFDARGWRASSWETARSGDVATRLGQQRSDDYATAFRDVATERELQWKLLDAYAEVMSARHGADEAGRPARLAALERYRQTGLIAERAAGHFLQAVSALGVKPTEDAIQRAQQENDLCLTRIAAPPRDPAPGAR